MGKFYKRTLPCELRRSTSALSPLIYLSSLNIEQSLVEAMRAQ